MTKKELLENKYFKDLPDDAELLIRCKKDEPLCIPILHEDVEVSCGRYSFDNYRQIHSYIIFNPPKEINIEYVLKI